MSFDNWEIVLRPSFIITAGLVLAGFLPLLLSIRATWLANGEKKERATRE
jgi:hypothetical protein